MALNTVADYIVEARTMLQDKTESYRYSDLELISALNLGIMSARRARPDLFMDVAEVPSYTVADITAATVFDMDQQYRTPFVFFIVGFAQLRDEEDTQDARAAALLGKFAQQLVVLS